MKLSVFAAVLASAGCASASILIPDSLQDGIYEAHPHPDAASGHLIKRIDTTVSSSSSSGDHLTKHGAVHPRKQPKKPQPGTVRNHDKLLKEVVPLPDTRAFCRVKEHTMTLDNLHEAINRLFYTPLFWIPERSARFALYNGTVAYICNLRLWSAGSLVEYMEAMRILDERCLLDDDEQRQQGGQVVVRAGKLAIRDWDKFYGREVAGVEICLWESEEGGIKHDLMEKEEEECTSWVNGISRYLGSNGVCGGDAEGPSLGDKLKGMFPWYQGTIGAATAG